MALDTRNRRASAVAFAIGHGRVWPNPDGTIDQPDRQHIGWSYPGIAAAASVAADDVGGGSLFGALNGLHFHIKSRVYRRKR